MVVAEIANGAYQDGTVRHVPIIFLAGPIKHWWTCWGSPEHLAYVKHRDLVRATLIETGYLTYASWDAIKGSWDPRAQLINDTAIQISDLLIIMTPPGIPADGTELETHLARCHKVPILEVPPGTPLGWSRHGLLYLVRKHVGEGVRYD